MSKFTLILLLLLSSFAQAANGNNVEKLKWLETANPITDAKKAIERNDKRLRAVYGYTLTIPGTELKKLFEYRKSHGVLPIEGTSDNILNEEHARLINLAIEYAKQYNRIILGASVK